MAVNYHSKIFYSIGPWAEFSTLDLKIRHEITLITKQPNLMLKHLVQTTFMLSPDSLHPPS
jgi:hypothetical protein